MMIGFYGSALTVGGVFVALFTCTIIESLALAPHASVSISVGMSYLTVALFLTLLSIRAIMLSYQTVGRFHEHTRSLQEVPAARGLHFVS